MEIRIPLKTDSKGKLLRMLKIIELFAGVGSQTQALKNIGVEHEVVGIAEIDKYAISSYMQLHGETHNFGDISKIESLPTADLWTYSFPCQDISVSGKGEGIKIGTRSGLLFEVERLLESSQKPKYLLMENVKNLIGKNNIKDFESWCKKLEELGYRNYYEVLNSKHYGIPQNRERVFMVSILGEHDKYNFPEPEELKVKLIDILEDNVKESFYLDKKVVEKFKYNSNLEMEGGNRQPKVLLNKVIGASRGRNPSNPSDRTTGAPTEQRLEINFNETSNTLTTVQKDNYVVEGKILIKNATKQGYLEANVGDYINLQFPESETRRGRVQKDVSATLMCNDSNGVLEQDFRIRKLTPLECWRLMGWKDEQFNKIQGISNSQLYKQAGNGIVVDVLERIFEKMFKGE